jgi:hypothetical protein
MRTHCIAANCQRVSWICGAALAVIVAASALWAQSSAPNAPKKDEKVKVEAHLSVDKLPAGGKCQILVRLNIEPGWHISAIPNTEGTLETEIEFKGKLGTQLTGKKAPKGKLLKLVDLEEPVSVYDGKIDIRGVLEIPADAAGKTEEMEIVVKYQACDKDTCLLPTSTRLAGKLAVAKPGETVRSINEKLFPPAGGDK